MPTQPTPTSAFEGGYPTPGGYRDVTPRAAYAARGKIRLVDVREAHELTGPLGHMPGVELVPMATIPEQSAGWDRETEIILVCASGARSGRVAGFLAAAGFRRVMNMAGGMIAYHAAGLPVGRGQVPGS